MDRSDLIKRSKRNIGCTHSGIQAGKNILGNRYGSWTVVGYDRGNERAFWTCKCDCGTVQQVGTTALKSGESTSCGCKRKVDLTGNRFGRLLVIGIDKEKTRVNHKVYLCRCDCGNLTSVSHSNIAKNKGTTSCGCYAKEVTSKRVSQSSNHFFGKYKWYLTMKDGSRLRCKSSYEVFLWNYFTYVLGEDIFYEPKVFVIEKDRRYKPDFYIPSENKWIELKGSFFFTFDTSKQEEKIEILKNKFGENIEIWFWKDMLNTLKLPFKSFDTYKQSAKRMKVSFEDYLGRGMYDANISSSLPTR